MFSKKIGKKLNSPVIILTSGVIYLISQFLIIHILSTLELHKVLQLQTTFSSSKVQSILDGWRKTGEINLYLSHFYADFLHPIWYGLFLGSLLSRMICKRELPDRYYRILLFPWTAGFLDILENIHHLAFIYLRGSIMPLWVFLSGMATNLKWMLSFLTLLSILFIWRYKNENSSVSA